MNAFNKKKDEDLILLLRNGDKSAFTEIYNRYWGKLYYIAHRLIKNTDAAEEIVQDVFLAIWQKRETLNIDCLTAYLAAMTRYAVFRYISKEKRYKEQENKLALSNAAAISEFNVDDKILLEIIARLANKLPEKCRLVFQYNKLQDQSLIDVAAQLNMTQKTAEAHLTKALRIIRASAGDLLIFLTAILSIMLFKR